MARHPIGENKNSLTGTRAFFSTRIGWLIVAGLVGLVLLFLVVNNDFEEDMDTPVEQTETIYDDDIEREPTAVPETEGIPEDHPDEGPERK